MVARYYQRAPDIVDKLTAANNGGINFGGHYDEIVKVSFDGRHAQDVCAGIITTETPSTIFLTPRVQQYFEFVAAIRVISACETAGVPYRDGGIKEAIAADQGALNETIQFLQRLKR
jgi:hypothetical protein